jgi:hypothetical protein
MHELSEGGGSVVCVCVRELQHEKYNLISLYSKILFTPASSLQSPTGWHVRSLTSELFRGLNEKSYRDRNPSRIKNPLLSSLPLSTRCKASNYWRVATKKSMSDYERIHGGASDVSPWRLSHTFLPLR